MDIEKLRAWVRLGTELETHSPESFERAVTHIAHAISAARILSRHDTSLMLRPKKTLRRYQA